MLEGVVSGPVTPSSMAKGAPSGRCARTPRIGPHLREVQPQSRPGPASTSWQVVLTVLTPLEAALADWYKVQAVETLKDRLSKDDFQVGRAGGWWGGWLEGK